MGESDISGTVVVVADDPHLRDEVRHGLSGSMTVELVGDAREAWKALETTTPVAVVIEMRTGSAGGFGLSRDMSQVPRLAGVPVLMLLERKQDEWLAREAGAKLIRIMPIDSANLERDVRSLIA